MSQLAGWHDAVALNPLSSTSLLASLGALGVFLALFAETGLLIGFFLPGDSLLFTAGLLCATTSSGKVHLSLPLVLLAAAGGALLGAQTGFVIGRKGGVRGSAGPRTSSCSGPPSGLRTCCRGTGTARPSCWPGSSRSSGRC